MHVSSTQIKSKSSPVSLGLSFLSAFGFAQICSWGTVYYSFPQIAFAMSAEFDWSKSDAYGALTVGLFMSALAAVPVGMSIDKGHGRNVMTFGSIFAGALLIAWSQVESLLTFYVIFAGIGFLQAALLYSAAFAVVAKHCEKTKIRGYITTLTLWGGFASTLFIPLIEWLMSYMDWRSILVVLGGVNIFVCAGIYWQLPSGKYAEKIPDESMSEVCIKSSVSWVLGQPIFWAILVCFSVYSVMASSFRFHLYPLLIESGLTGENAVFILATLGPAQVAGRALMMFVKTRSIAYIGIFVASLFPLSFIAMILYPTNFPILIVAGIVFGTAAGIMTIIQGVAIPEFLTKRAYGTINGIMNIPITILKALAPTAAALSWMITGSYAALMVGLVIISAVMLISFIITTVIAKRKAKKQY